MKVSKVLQAAFVGAAAIALGTGGAFAVCAEFGGFAVFQCADLAYFQPSPLAVTLDAAGRLLTEPALDANGVVDPTKPWNWTGGVKAVFWQLGFGNANTSSGLGPDGTGNSALATFNGNDSGLFTTDIGDIGIITGFTGAPPGALCLANNNWGNTGVDGCADNSRADAPNPTHDGILNPVYDVYRAKSGTPGYYSRMWYVDYPMAVMLKTCGDAANDPNKTCAIDNKFFAIAAVSTLDRPNDRSANNGQCCNAGNEPCSPGFQDICNGAFNPAAPPPPYIFTPTVTHCWGNQPCPAAYVPGPLCESGTNGYTFAYNHACGGYDCTGVDPANPPNTNPGPCDFRMGSYPLMAIVNGLANPLAPGQNNVVPWQATPRPKITCTANCTGTTTNRTLTIKVDPAKWYHDRKMMRSANPQMGGDLDPSGVNDPTRAAGVGVRDLLIKWQGLLRYDLQKSQVLTAANIDPNGRVKPTTLTWTNVLGAGGAPICTVAANGGLCTDMVPPLDANGEPLTDPNTRMITRTAVISPVDRCYRLVVKFGKKQEQLTMQKALCRLGKCGDQGFQVQSIDPEAIVCVGGALLSEKIDGQKASRSKGKFDISWSTSSEIAVTNFRISAVRPVGEKFLLDVPCKECNSGIGANYSVSLPSSQVKGGARAFTIEMFSGNGNVKVTVPIL